MCLICNHKKRKEIDDLILARSFGSGAKTLAEIADEYDVPLRALQIHSVSHFESPTDVHSISDKINFKEADYLRETMKEYFVTLKNTGVRVNTILGMPITDMGHGLSDSLITLYIQLGKNIQGIIETMVKLDQAVNGDINNGAQAIADLVGAITGSAGKSEDED